MNVRYYTRATGENGIIGSYNRIENSSTAIAKSYVKIRDGEYYESAFTSLIGGDNPYYNKIEFNFSLKIKILS